MSASHLRRLQHKLSGGLQAPTAASPPREAGHVDALAQSIAALVQAQVAEALEAQARGAPQHVHPKLHNLMKRARMPAGQADAISGATQFTDDQGKPHLFQPVHGTDAVMLDGEVIPAKPKPKSPVGPVEMKIVSRDAFGRIHATKITTPDHGDFICTVTQRDELFRTAAVKFEKATA